MPFLPRRTAPLELPPPVSAATEAEPPVPDDDLVVEIVGVRRTVLRAA